MIPKTLVLDIVTPDRPMVRAEVDEVQLPGADGALGILPGHAPMLAALEPGELWFREGAEKQYLSISFGVAALATIGIFLVPSKVKVGGTASSNGVSVGASGSF